MKNFSQSKTTLTMSLISACLTLTTLVACSNSKPLTQAPVTPVTPMQGDIVMAKSHDQAMIGAIQAHEEKTHRVPQSLSMKQIVEHAADEVRKGANKVIEDCENC